MTESDPRSVAVEGRRQGPLCGVTLMPLVGARRLVGAVADGDGSGVSLCRVVSGLSIVRASEGSRRPVSGLVGIGGGITGSGGGSEWGSDLRRCVRPAGDYVSSRRGIGGVR